MCAWLDVHTPLAMPYKLVSVASCLPIYPSAVLQGQTSSLSWLRPWARILFGLLLPLAVLLVIVLALLTPPPPPNTSLAGLPLPCGVAMPAFGCIVTRLSFHLSTVLCNDIFVVCCAVLFSFGFHCIVLFCLCMLSGHFFIYF